MKRHESARPRARVVSVVLAVFLGWAAGVGAAEPGGSAKPEGIKVHGDWTIEIRNPDGSLASRHEFTNALVPGEGDVVLAGLLGRTLPPFIWQVQVGDSTASGGPCAPGREIPPEALPCTLMEPGLTITVAPGGTVQLSGSVTAQRPASVPRVTTIVGVGTSGFFSRFSEKQLSPPIPVTAGQIIQVRVVFSFS